MTQTEFLTSDEVAELSGYKHIAMQKEWLDRNGWKYVTNAAGRPIVGRYFARMQLAGVSCQNANAPAWKPDFSALK